LSFVRILLVKYTGLVAIVA